MTLGLETRTSYPKIRRWRIVSALLVHKLNPVIHNTLTHKDLDQLIWLGTRSPPTASLGNYKSMGIRTHTELIKALTDEAKKHQESFNDLDETFSNLQELAERHGWQPEWNAKYKSQRPLAATTPPLPSAARPQP